MKKNRLTIILLVLVMFLTACGKSQPQEKVQPTITPAPVETEVAITTVDVSHDANAFFKMLQTCLMTHDYDSLQALMQEPFTIAGWQAESSQTDTQSAIAELRNRFLPENSTITFRPLENAETLLGGTDPYAMWGPNAAIVNILYSQGWGVEGTAEALLLVSQTEDGSYRWYGILYAPDGFSLPTVQPVQQTQPGVMPESGDVAAFKAALIDALSAETLDDAVLISMMSDPFITEGWWGSGALWTPAEAVGILKSESIPATLPEKYFSQYDIVQLLNGQDPLVRYASAVGFIYSQGWGADGKHEVLLVISDVGDGTLRWNYLLTAADGFTPLP